MLLQLAGISKQIYLYNVKHMDDKDNKDKEIKEEIFKIFMQNYEKYGIPRMTIELNNRGYHINHKRIERLMTELSLKARPKQRKYRSYKGDIGRIADNVLNRDFTTTSFYEKLGTDVTVFIGTFGRLYLSPIIDFHHREILSYDLSTNPDFRQIDRMFKELKDKHGDNFKDTIIQSDQGWQYQMSKYRDKLKELKMIQSMSRKGNCLDNSPTENFFGRMKEEMFYGKEYLYETIDQLKQAIREYINYYNNVRIVRKLKMSPLQYKKSHHITVMCV